MASGGIGIGPWDTMSATWTITHAPTTYSPAMWITPRLRISLKSDLREVTGRFILESFHGYLRKILAVFPEFVAQIRLPSRIPSGAPAVRHCSIAMSIRCTRMKIKKKKNPKTAVREGQR